MDRPLLRDRVLENRDPDRPLSTCANAVPPDLSSIPPPSGYTLPRYALYAPAEIMNEERFFIDMKYIPGEVRPKLDKIKGVNWSGRAHMYYFHNYEHPQVVMEMLRLTPPVFVSNIPQWEPGSGIIIAEGAVNRRRLNDPGIPKYIPCYLYDFFRFCVNDADVPEGLLPFVGNLDIQPTDRYHRNRMWHFPREHLYAFFVALRYFREAETCGSLGQINHTNSQPDIQVRVLNLDRFYIVEPKHNPWTLTIDNQLRKVKGSCYDIKLKRWDFENCRYFEVKNVFASYSRPFVLGFIEYMRKSDWRNINLNPKTNALERRAFSLIPTKREFLAVNNSTEPKTRDGGAQTRTNSSSPIQSNSRSQADKGQTQSSRPGIGSSLPGATLPPRYWSNRPVRVHAVRENEQPNSRQKENSTVSQSSQASRQLPGTSTSTIFDPEVQIQRIANPTNSLVTQRSTSLQLQSSNEIRVFVQVKSVQPTTQSSKPRSTNIDEIPGFQIVKNLTPNVIFTSIPPRWFTAEMKLKFSSRPDNLGSNWSLLLRLDQSPKGVIELHSKVTIINDNKICLKICDEGSGFHLNITDDICWNQENTIRMTVEVHPTSNLENFMPELKAFIGIARYLNASELLQELGRAPRIRVETTQAMVQKILKESAESGISTDDSKFTVSLKCPLGKGRIKTPCRSQYCKHCNCFDAANFFNLYNGTDDWKCPICASTFLMDDLRIDGFLEMVLQDKQAGNAKNDEVKIDANGNFTICSSGEQNQRSGVLPIVINIDDTIVENAEMEVEKRGLDASPRAGSNSNSDDSVIIISPYQVETAEVPKQAPAAPVPEPVKEKSAKKKKNVHSDESDVDSEPLELKKKKRRLTADVSKAKSKRSYCRCKTECKTNRCPCRKNDRPCSSTCHKDNNCANC